MIEKIAERSNVLTETENKSFMHAVINAVTKGYSDNTILEDIIELVRRKEVSKGILQTAPETLRMYAESINNSLNFLSDQIDQLDVIDEPTVKRKEINKDDHNIIEEEMNKQQDDQGVDKKASFNKFTNLIITEDWNRYSYNNLKNIMSGHLKICFNQDLTQYKNSNNKIILTKNDVEDTLSKIYAYFSSEFKNLKAELSPDIFKSDIKFDSLEKGEAFVDYEIKGAF